MSHQHTGTVTARTSKGDHEAIAAAPAAPTCRICGSAALRQLWRTDFNDVGPVTADFRITDAGYGRTGTMHECSTCGFRQCSDLGNVLSFYENMVDEEYEHTRAPRALQARRLLSHLGPFKSRGRLLDIGAGSGILVEEAVAIGYSAEGVEPSSYLQEQAHRRRLSVYRGVLPHVAASGPYDVVTMVDVIEHVTDPIDLLRKAVATMAEDGVLLVVTPDVRSVAARLLGRQWWHYRIAHIGYFDRMTLENALAAAGLRPIRIARPSWYFPASYLAERAFRYLPTALRLQVSHVLGNVTVRLNLFDSILMVCRRVG